MKSFFKYFGIIVFLLFGFYYSEKMSVIVMQNNKLFKEISNRSNDYTIKPVSAIIDGDYIIPGLNGYAVNVLKSYDNMRHIDTFNSYYLDYDIIKPSISLENNKNKIIKYGNKYKNSVAIVINNNKEILNYSLNNNIKITRLVNKSTFDKYAKYEQINNDDESYYELENLLDTYVINTNLCYVKNLVLCNNKYIFTESILLNNYNLGEIKSKIRSGYIIYINDDVNITDFKILVRQIYYQDLDIVYLSSLIKEERD